VSATAATTAAIAETGRATAATMVRRHARCALAVAAEKPMKSTKRATVAHPEKQPTQQLCKNHPAQQQVIAWQQRETTRNN
jgi:hypothetical protein